MTTGKRRSNGQLARDRRRISDLYLQGWLQADIAEEIGINQSTVSRDLKGMQADWLESSLIDINKKKCQELAKVDRLEREYWIAWERSCEDAEITRQKAIKSKDGTERQEAFKEEKGQAGDPRFLTGVQWCINKRCEILGIDAAVKQDITSGGKSMFDLDEWRKKAEDNARQFDEVEG